MDQDCDFGATDHTAKKQWMSAQAHAWSICCLTEQFMQAQLESSRERLPGIDAGMQCTVMDRSVSRDNLRICVQLWRQTGETNLLRSTKEPPKNTAWLRG